MPTASPRVKSDKVHPHQKPSDEFRRLHLSEDKRCSLPSRGTEPAPSISPLFFHSIKFALGSLADIQPIGKRSLVNPTQASRAFGQAPNNCTNFTICTLRHMNLHELIPTKYPPQPGSRCYCIITAFFWIAKHGAANPTPDCLAPAALTQNTIGRPSIPSLKPAHKAANRQCSHHQVMTK